MQQRTDIPTMYPEELVYELDDGTLAVVVIRQATSDVPGALVLAVDCWEVDPQGAPTGITVPRWYHTQNASTIRDGVGLGDLDAICDARRDDVLALLQAAKTYAAQLTSGRVRLLTAPPAPSPDVPHPLEASADTVEAALAALSPAGAP